MGSSQSAPRKSKPRKSKPPKKTGKAAPKKADKGASKKKTDKGPPKKETDKGAPKKETGKGAPKIPGHDDYDQKMPASADNGSKSRAPRLEARQLDGDTINENGNSDMNHESMAGVMPPPPMPPPPGEGMLPPGDNEIVFPEIVIQNSNDINNANENENQVASANENANDNPNNLGNQNANQNFDEYQQFQNFEENTFKEQNAFYNEEKTFYYVAPNGGVTEFTPGTAEADEVPDAAQDYVPGCPDCAPPVPDIPNLPDSVLSLAKRGDATSAGVAGTQVEFGLLGGVMAMWVLWAGGLGRLLA